MRDISKMTRECIRGNKSMTKFGIQFYTSKSKWI